MKKKIIALMLMGAIMTTSLSGCAKLNAIKDIITGETPVGDEVEDVIDDIEDEVEDEAEDEAEDKKDGKLKGLTAKKIGSLEVGGITAEDGGVYYEDKYKEGLYGVMSKDGSKKSEAKYTYCNASKYSELFAVSESLNETTSAATMNVLGVVDASGKEIIPQKYAHVEFLNEKFVKVIEVTVTTTNEDEALIFIDNSDSILNSISPSEGDTLYKGTWYVFDLETGKAVPGATGTLPYNVSATGEFITYVDDNKTKHTVTETGKNFDGADPFDNGSYVVDGVVYDTNGATLWKFGPNDYEPQSYENGYYLGRKYENGNSKYAVLDSKGKIIKEITGGYPSIYGDYYRIDDSLYNFDGELVKEGVSAAYYEEYTGDYIIVDLNDDKGYIMYDMDSNVVLNGENQSYDMDTFTFNVENNSSDTYYCIKDGAFNITGAYDMYEPWIVKKNNSVIDTISGATLMENYSEYDVSYSELTGEYYIYATVSGTTDIYRITY